MMKRKIYKVPVSSIVPSPSITNLHSTSKYFYRLDFFYPEEWDKNTKRKVVIHFPGAGVNGPYATTNDMMARYSQENLLTCVVYYYQPTFKDPENPEYITPKPFWNERWGDNYNHQHHLRCRSIMVQSALEFVVDRLASETGFDIDTDNIYMTSKSRGGASVCAWSYFNRSYKYQDKVKLIVNSQGYAGSAAVSDPTGGWLSWKSTIDALSLYSTWSQHNIIHVYNDKDHGYDLGSRIAFSIPSNRLQYHRFMNFTDYGHTAINDFNAEAIKADIQGIPLTYKGTRVYTQEELTLQSLNK